MNFIFPWFKNFLRNFTGKFQYINPTFRQRLPLSFGITADSSFVFFPMAVPFHRQDLHSRQNYNLSPPIVQTWKRSFCFRHSAKFRKHHQHSNHKQNWQIFTFTALRYLMFQWQHYLHGQFQFGLHSIFPTGRLSHYCVFPSAHFQSAPLSENSQ